MRFRFGVRSSGVRQPPEWFRTVFLRIAGSADRYDREEVLRPGYAYDGGDREDRPVLGESLQWCELRYHGSVRRLTMGKKNHAIYLDTATLEYEYAPLELGDARIVIACSNKKRGLADSAYNTRRSECETALQPDISRWVKVDTLGDLSEEEFEQYKDAIKDPVRVRKRPVMRSMRIKEPARRQKLLKKGDLAEFGRLMNESHRIAAR